MVWRMMLLVKITPLIESAFLPIVITLPLIVSVLVLIESMLALAESMLVLIKIVLPLIESVLLPAEVSIDKLNIIGTRNLESDFIWRVFTNSRRIGRYFAPPPPSYQCRLPVVVPSMFQGYRQANIRTRLAGSNGR